MKKANVSQNDYKSMAKSTGAYVQRQSERLADIAHNLNKSEDFSPCTIQTMRQVMTDMKALQEILKAMVDTSVQRGCAHFDEQKGKLLEGSLRLNRRVSDMAAE